MVLIDINARILFQPRKKKSAKKRERNIYNFKSMISGARFQNWVKKQKKKTKNVFPKSHKKIYSISLKKMHLFWNLGKEKLYVLCAKSLNIFILNVKHKS